VVSKVPEPVKPPPEKKVLDRSNSSNNHTPIDSNKLVDSGYGGVPVMIKPTPSKGK